MRPSWRPRLSRNAAPVSFPWPLRLLPALTLSLWGCTAFRAAASGGAFSGEPTNAHFVSQGEALGLREEVRRMFLHAYDGYMQHAFPRDELKPMSCRGEDTLGGYALTLIDALDTLALLGNKTEFGKRVRWLGRHLNFDKNKTVSLFETNIRVLGGLLSAHLIASDDATGVLVPGYTGELLVLAEDLGRRLLPAFDTPTGIPFGSVNLRHGVDPDESIVTSTAGGGTLILEFATLSRLTGDPVFERVAREALLALWVRRSRLGLVGAHINIQDGEWTHKDAGIGTSIDSFYEYLFKAYVLLGDPEYLDAFRESYAAALKHLFHDPWYIEVNMDAGVMVWPLFNSLQAFWPGLQVQAGDVEKAVRTHRAFFSVWRRYGFTPEGFNLQHGIVQPGQESYPLRPELAESTYWLYKATRDPWYLEVGRDILTSLSLTRCQCGYCHVSHVEGQGLTDHMESFFLAETVKYLFLLFDLAATNGDNLFDNGPYQYVLTTEGHYLPLTPEIALAAEEGEGRRAPNHCSYLGAYCGAAKGSSCRLEEGPSGGGSASTSSRGSRTSDSSNGRGRGSSGTITEIESERGHSSMPSVAAGEGNAGQAASQPGHSFPESNPAGAARGESAGGREAEGQSGVRGNKPQDEAEAEAEAEGAARAEEATDVGNAEAAVSGQFRCMGVSFWRTLGL